MLRFKNQNLINIIEILKIELENSDSKIEFEVINPDIQTSIYSGSKIIIKEQEYIYRSYKSWIDLAEILYCKMLTPVLVDENIVRISFIKLDKNDSFHKLSDDREKYGVSSIFFDINKNEEPAFLHYYKEALQNVKIQNRLRVLNIGINSGDEFDVIRSIVSNFKEIEFVGVDYCQSAIKTAQNRFTEKNISFLCADVNELNSLNLGKFDLIISIGTLQSSNIEFNSCFMNLVQNYLIKDGAMILGFPNCRWIGGEMIYGANMKNYSYSEMSNLYKDVNFCKKYLQQKKFRVTITGKNYIFLTATSIRKE